MGEYAPKGEMGHVVQTCEKAFPNAAHRTASLNRGVIHPGGSMSKECSGNRGVEGTQRDVRLHIATADHCARSNILPPPAPSIVRLRPGRQLLTTSVPTVVDRMERRRALTRG